MKYVLYAAFILLVSCSRENVESSTLEQSEDNAAVSSTAADDPVFDSLTDVKEISSQSSLEKEEKVESKEAAKPSTKKGEYRTVEWTDLMPQEDFDALSNPPEYISQIQDGSEDDMIAGQLKSDAGSGSANDPYQQALISKKIRTELDQQNIRIPGFIVPLEFNDDQVITTFFLVPFFGACIHQPPPPPNQIIYSEYEPGFRLEALFDPFWIEGKLLTSLVENDMATAAYSMNVTSIKPYYEDE